MKNILLVDDDDDVLSALKRVLTNPKEGWVCHVARDGREALDLLGLRAYDLLITDLNMPVMDGFELLANAKRLYPGLAAVVLSGLADLAAEQRLGSYGDLEVLQKPIPAARLKKVVAEVMAQRTLGHVQGISLTSMIQLMHLEKKTCTVRAIQEARWGELYLDRGRLVGAHLDDGRQGEEAAMAMFTWNTTAIELLPLCPRDTRPIEADLNFLMLEAARLLDEEGPEAEPILDLPSLEQEATLALDGGPAGMASGLSFEAIVEAMQRRVPSDLQTQAVLVADRSTGGVLAQLTPGRPGLGLEHRLSSATESLAREAAWLGRSGIDQGVEEIVFVSDDCCELVRPMASHPGAFLYGLFDRKEYAVGMASLVLRSIEGGSGEYRMTAPPQ